MSELVAWRAEEYNTWYKVFLKNISDDRLYRSEKFYRFPSDWEMETVGKGS